MTGQRLVFWKVAKRPTCGESRSPGWGVLRTKSVTWKTPRDYHVCEFMLSCVRPFATLWIVARQAPLSMGFSRQEFWSGLPFPPWGDLPEPGIKPTSCVAPALAGKFFIVEPPGKTKFCHMFDTSYYGMFLKYLPISTLRHLFFNFCYFTS